MNPRVVVKVGGSLLDWPELRPRLASFLETLRTSASPSRLVLVVGGGGAADLIRRFDRIQGLGELRSHRLAVRSLDLTARMIEALDPRLYAAVETLADCLRPPNGRIPILAPRRFLEEIDAQGSDPLRASWEVTSDSIAARIARAFPADRLILLKSAGPTEDLSAVRAARLGLVDEEFPRAGRGIERVSLLNLRSDSPREVRLSFDSDDRGDAA